jgi:hypothetical protein
MTDSRIFNPRNLPRLPLGGQGFIPSQGRVGVPSQHPAIPAHKDVVVTPIMPTPDSAPKPRDIGTNPRSR